MKKVLAIITARSGSKGLVDKNIKLLLNKPLMAYSIESAKDSGLFDYIAVSTDSQKYADIAAQYGAQVPFLRSAELSLDDSKTVDVIIDLIDKLEKMGKSYDSFVLLQPTSPLRAVSDIKNAYNLFIKKDANSVVGVCEAEHSPRWMNTLKGDLSLQNFLVEKDTNRQQLEKFYRINGAIYIAKVDYYKQNRDFFGRKSFAYIMDKKNSIDIDDKFDFELAEFFMSKNAKENC